MTKRKAEYKPLYFTTTIRNPERIKPFLEVFSKYNNKILDNSLIIEVCKDLIKENLYTPTKISEEVKNKLKSGISITDKEAQKIIEIILKIMEKQVLIEDGLQDLILGLKLRKNLDLFIMNMERK